MVIGKSFPATSGVGHTVWAEAEAAFFWPSLLPTVTTRLAYTVLPTSQLWSQQCWLDAAWGFTPWFRLSLAYRAQKPIVACELWPFSQTICLLKIPSSKGLIDTHIHFGSSGNIWPKGLFLSWLILPPAINLTFLPNCAEVPLSNICYLFRWSPHIAFFSSCSPHNLLRKDPSSPFWSSEETVRALCWWHSHPLSASFLSGLQGTRGPMKGTCCCCPALAMPQTHLSPDFNAGSFPDALRCQDFEGGTRSQKTLALETYSYSPERKDSLSKPHPFTATQFPFFVSWLKPMSFFFFFSAAWYLVPCCCPYSTPHPSCLRPSFAWDLLSLLWKNPSQHYWGHWDSRLGWVEQTRPQANLPEVKDHGGGQHREWRLTEKRRNADMWRQNKGTGEEGRL